MTWGDNQKPHKGKELQGRVATMPSAQLFQRKHSTSLSFSTSNGPTSSFPSGGAQRRLDGLSCLWLVSLCVGGQAWYQGLSALAVLIRSLPGAAGTSSDECSGERSQAFDGGRHLCAKGQDVAGRDCDRQWGNLLLLFNSAVFTLSDGNYLSFSTWIRIPRIFCWKELWRWSSPTPSLIEEETNWQRM